MVEIQPIQRINELETRKIRLDKKDMRILSVLLNNARTPFTEMAKTVMLSKDAVKYRITKLQERGIILRFYPLIDYSMLGFNEFKVKLLLDEGKKEEQEKFLEEITSHPNILSIIEYSDRWDIEITVLARTLREFDDIDLELTSKYKDIILQKDKHPIVKHYLRDLCPLEFQQDQSYLEKLEKLPYETKPDIKIDLKDRKILRELSKNCRASTYEMMAKINLSADAIGLRIKRMVKTGLIEKFTIAPNYSMLNYHMYSFEADISCLDSESEKKLINFAIFHPFIFSAKKAMGYYDVIIKIMSKSPRDMHLTIEGVKRHFSQVIREYETLISYKEHCFCPFPEALLTQNLKG